MTGIARTHTHAHTPTAVRSIADVMMWDCEDDLKSLGPECRSDPNPALARQLWSHDRLPKSFEEQTCRSETVADLRAASRLVGDATENQTLWRVFTGKSAFWLSDRQITALTVLLKLWYLWASLPGLVIFWLALLEVQVRTLQMKLARNTTGQNCLFPQKEMWSWN